MPPCTLVPIHDGRGGGGMEVRCVHMLSCTLVPIHEGGEWDYNLLLLVFVSGVPLYPGARTKSIRKDGKGTVICN